MQYGGQRIIIEGGQENLGYRVKANCSHMGPGPTGGRPSVGGLSKGS